MSAFHHEPRKPLTDQQKAKLFLERGGRCHRCKRKLRPGDDWTDEHVIALENGGTNAWDNRDVTCSWCFKPKNAADARIAAKGRATAVANIIPTKRRQAKTKKMPGGKGSQFKKRMDGKVIDRETGEPFNGGRK